MFAGLVCFLIILGVGCQGDASGPPPVPAQLAKVRGDGQTAMVASALADSLVVKVTDAGGRGIRAVTVTWVVVAGGGSVSPTSSQTNAAGEAKTRWTLGTGAGAQSVSASVSGLTDVTFTGTGTAAAAVALTKAAGDAQTGTVASALADSLVVRVSDQYGNPVPNATVTWAAASGSGSVSPASSTTSASGEARALWTLGQTAGAQSAIAASGANLANFSATATAAAAASLSKVGGDNQTATVGSAPTDSLAVRVADQFGNAVSGVTVNWAVTAGGGSVSPASSASGANGEAKTRWTLGTTSGANTVSASATGLSAVSFNATGAAGPPAALTKVSGDNQSTALAATVPESLVVKVVDQHGNAVAGSNVAWAVTSGGGSVSPASMSSRSNGEARTLWTLGGTAGDQTASATVTGVSPATFTATAVLGSFNLTVGGMYLTQGTQKLDRSVPLVKDRAGLLRVWVKASDVRAVTPKVRVRWYQSGSLVRTDTLSAPGATVDTVVVEEPLTTSWNLAVPGSLIQTGLEVLLDADPDNQVSEINENDNTFPTSGTPLALDVRAASTFNVTFVPVLQTVNGLQGDVTDANKDQFLASTQKMHPLPGTNAVVHAVYSTSTPPLESGGGNWVTLLNEINTLRTMEAPTRYHYGIVRVSYTSGVAGIAFVPGRAGVGWDFLPSGDGIAAHEWGHNFGRQHSPCGSPGGVDPNYPYADGSIGVYGLDVAASLLKPPGLPDVMSYCSGPWISDYTYKGVLTYRLSADPGAPPGGGAPQPVLLVWGRASDDGLVLEPAFQVTAPPVLPAEPGPYRLEGLDANGATLFSLSFRGDEVADLPGHRQFAFALPAALADTERLAALRFSDGGRSVERRTAAFAAVGGARPEPALERVGPDRVRLRWNALAHPMALVRDARTGQVLSFARDGAVLLATRARELDVTFSDGVRGPRQRVPVPR